MPKRVLEIEEKSIADSLTQLFAAIEKLAHQEPYKDQYTVLKVVKGYQAHLGGPVIDQLKYLPCYRSLQAALKALIAREQDRVYGESISDGKRTGPQGSVLRGKAFASWRKNGAITLGQVARAIAVSSMTIGEWESKETVCLNQYQEHELKEFISTRANDRTQSRLWTDEEADENEEEEEDDDEDDDAFV